MPMMVALVTKPSPWYAIYVLAAYYFIQLIDNHYIVPYIVASKIKINALFSVIVVLVGNAIWGIPGMFLSMPLLAIIKLICDHIEPLKTLGLPIGRHYAPHNKDQNDIQENQISIIHRGRLASSARVPSQKSCYSTFYSCEPFPRSLQRNLAPKLGES